MNYTVTVQGTTVAFATTCDVTHTLPATMSRGYTATPGHLRFVFEYQQGQTTVAEYARQ